MTIAQIMAVLSLLLAFNVDPATVKNVEVILMQHPQVVVQSATIKDMANIKKEIKDPIVGKSLDGHDVFKGATTFYVIDEKDCKWSVKSTGDNTYTNGQKMIWCPAK
jgi:hypothetical protein